MLLEILRQWDHSRAHRRRPGPYVFDMSVGYDLAGISDTEVAAFIRGMRDATAEIEALRVEIPDRSPSSADFDFTHISPTR